jgi:hypothetical protein
MNDTNSWIDTKPFIGWLCDIYASYKTIPDEYKQEAHPDEEKVLQCMKHLKRLSISVSTQENTFLMKLEKALKKKSFEDPELTLIIKLADSLNSVSSVSSVTQDIVKIGTKRSIHVANEDTNTLHVTISPTKKSPIKSPQAMSRLSIISSSDRNMVSMISTITSSKAKRQRNEKVVEYVIDNIEINEKLDFIDEIMDNGNDFKQSDDINEINQTDFNPVLDDDFAALLNEDYIYNGNQSDQSNMNENNNNKHYEHDNNNNSNNSTTTTNNRKEIDVWGSDVSSDLSKKFGLGF